MSQKKEGLQKAKKVRDYYNKPVPQPKYTLTSQNVYFNARDIVSVTGYFDPSQSDADFKHVWMKLTDYGNLQYFEEKHYMQALTIILKKEAYETFCDLRERDNNLTSIIEYFGSVYAKKRSIVADRNAVDHFTRKKDESLITCMDRCKLVVERLRMTTSTAAWPETSRTLRRNILIQVIKDNTARYIKMEEDEVYETTGLKYDFDKLVLMADRYERHHDSAPKEEVTTQYRAASGGLINSPEKIEKLKSQLSHFKGEQKHDQKVLTLESRVAQLEEELLSNAVRFKNDGRKDSTKEQRKIDFEARRKEARSSSQDRGRDLSATSDQGNNNNKMDTKEPYTPPTLKQQPEQPDSRSRTDRNNRDSYPRTDGNRRNDSSYNRDSNSRTDNRQNNSSYDRNRGRSREGYNNSNRYNNNNYGNSSQSRERNSYRNRSNSNNRGYNNNYQRSQSYDRYLSQKKYQNQSHGNEPNSVNLKDGQIIHIKIQTDQSVKN